MEERGGEGGSKQERRRVEERREGGERSREGRKLEREKSSLFTDLILLVLNTVHEVLLRHSLCKSHDQYLYVILLNVPSALFLKHLCAAYPILTSSLKDNRLTFSFASLVHKITCVTLCNIVCDDQQARVSKLTT